jgi:hypothetical protein
MDLHVTQESTEAGTHRTIHLNNVRDSGRENVAIFLEMVGERNVPVPQVLDGFVFGIVFYAMRLGQSIRVHGAMSRDALRNLNELQEAWCSWRPGRYQKVDISAEQIVDSVNGEHEKPAIAAFSGGVDSTFTLLRHATGKLSLASYPLKEAVLLVHGFDVPLDSPEHLEALKERTAPLLKELQLGVRVIRTNMKELDLQDWEDSHGSQLASCLHNYSHKFSYGLIGSSEPYNALVLPWGSNPATDHLLSGGTFRIVHDGAGYSRTEKVSQIATNPTATRTLKVCWEGKETFRNCGVCEKCVRTRLNFLAVGVSDPTCFTTPLDIRQIKAIPLRNDVDCAELASIVAYAKARGVEAAWLRDVEARVKGYKPPTGLRKLARKIENAWNLATRGEWKEIGNKLKAKIGCNK